MASIDYSNLSSTAMQYGPFFFSLLFVLGVTRWGYKIFKETNAGANTTPKIFNTVRLVFLGSFFFGLVLVGVSVTWWLRSRPTLFVFRGEIVDLQEYEKLAPASDKLYFRREPKEIIDEIPLRNEHFLIMQDAPLHRGDTFEVEFSKNNSARNKFQLVYDPAVPYPKFEVIWDDTLHTNVLRPCKQNPSGSAVARLLTWTVDAAQASISVYQGKSTRQQAVSQVRSPVSVLQDSSSDVGSKIVALDQLDHMPSSAITESAPSGHEPVLATLLDLTRYSDKEVSYKAMTLMKKVDLDQYLVQKLDSEKSSDRAEGEQVLAKLDAADSARILQKVSPPRSAALRVKTAQWTTQQVVATPSPQGDRYYVRATWDGHSPAAVDCLTHLFHEELLSGSSRTLQQERALMSRGQRLVYGYEKEWSIGIAQKIQACGGAATFVQAGTK